MFFERTAALLQRTDDLIDTHALGKEILYRGIVFTDQLLKKLCEDRIHFFLDALLHFLFDKLRGDVVPQTVVCGVDQCGKGAYARSILAYFLTFPAGAALDTQTRPPEIVMLLIWTSFLPDSVR